MTLNMAKKNKTYQIVGFVGQADKVLRRFFELGFCEGQRVKILATSMAKKVFLIQLRGYVLSVRASLLQKVEVQECV